MKVMKKKLGFNSLINIGYIFLVCLSCHWMLFFNDGFFWDDNVHYGLIQGKHYAELSVFFLETGLPLNIIFFRSIDFLFGISNHRIVGFFTIFLSAVLISSLFRRYAGDFKSLSLVFVSLYLSLFPFKSTVLLCTLGYQVMLLFFILAVYIRVNFSEHDSAVVRFFALAGFALLSFVSFNTASILVLFYFFLSFEYFFAFKFSREAWSILSMWTYARRNLLVLLLPVAYWLVKSIFFPTHGLYENYNKISFNLKGGWDVCVAFFSGIFTYGPFHILATKTHSQAVLLSILMLFVVLTVFPRCWIVGKFHLPTVRINYVLTLCWSIAFLFISLLPYALVQQPPRFQGWESRHYLLFTLSLPVFVLIAVSIYFDRLKVIASSLSIGFIFRPLIISIVLVGVISSNIVYLDYQLLAIKQWAVVENLKAKPELKRYSSFRIDDQVGDFSRNGFSWYEANHQAWYEWVAIFKKAWSAEKWYGNNINEREEFFKGVRYGASDIDPAGEKCLLTLKNISPYGRIGTARRYWKLKYFGADSQLQEFLLSIVTIESCQSNWARKP
jgi:hypothetical protein